MLHIPSKQPPRRVLAAGSIIGTTQLHLRNPLITAFWSVMFPGLGHFLLGKYLRAFILFLWEIFINFQTHVNLALFYTLTGEIEAAKNVIDTNWSLIYIPTYLFTIWDSYRTTMDLNKQYLLASRENAPVAALQMSPLGINYLDKRPSHMPSLWCLLTPGLGQLALNRLVTGAFIIIWWICIVYQSGVLKSIYASGLGHFEQAKLFLDVQWFLNIPSVYFFCAYATLQNAVESNKLFDRMQSLFLRQNYQSQAFPYPSDDRSDGMYILSIFKQSIEVELAVTALEEEGISKRDILAVPIDKETPHQKLFDSMYASTGDSVFDIAMVLGSVFALLGCIYGFLLKWGPVIWGIIGALAGFGIGFMIKLLINKKKKKAGHINEVVIFVFCSEHKMENVKKLLSNHGALGVSIYGAAGCS